MDLTAGQVLNFARDKHPALSESNAPEPVGIRQLSELQRDLISEITIRMPGWGGSTLTVALPLASFAGGVDLNDEIPGDVFDMAQGTFIYRDLPDRDPRVANFVPWEQRTRPVTLPAFTLFNNILYFIGNEQNYASFSSFKLEYTAIPADVETVDTVLVLRTQAREALSWGLAAFWLMRLVKSPVYQVTADMASAINSRASEEREKFLNQIARLTQRQQHTVKIVY